MDWRRRQGLSLLLALSAWPLPTLSTGGRPWLIGFSQDTLANDWRAAQVRQLAQRFARETNVNFVFSDGDGQTAKQIADIEELVARGVDLLIVSPRDARAMAQPIARAMARRIPVVLLTRRVEGEAYTVHVGPDDVQIGEAAAHFLARRMARKGRVLMLEGVPTASTAIARGQGFRQGLKQYPDIELVASRPANYLRGDAITVMESLIYEGLQFDALFAQSDSMASGARLAMKKAGIDPSRKLIVGIDYIAEARQAILDGEQTASFTYPLSVDEVAELALKILRGQKVPRRVVVPSRLITRTEARQEAPIF